MDHFLPGVPTLPNDLKAGTFFLVNVGQRYTPAIMLENEGGRWVLDLDFDPGNEQREFHIISASAFNGRMALSIPDARIVPSIAPEHLRSGRPDDYPRNKALYIRPGALTVYVQEKGSTKRINLTAGSFYGESMEEGIYSTRWQVVCPTVDGGVQVLHEIAS